MPPLWKMIWWFPQPFKYIITIWLCNSTPRYISTRMKGSCSNKTCTQTIHSSTIHNSQKMEITQGSFNWWMEKQNWVYACIYACGHKKYLHMLQCEWILLSERSQIQRTTYSMIPFIGNVQIDKSIEMEGRLMIARA